MARIHAHVVAIDPSENLIKTAREHLTINPFETLSDRIEYRIETIEDHLTQTQTKYDAVVVSEVLEHVDDKAAFLKACTEPLAVSFHKSNRFFFGFFCLLRNLFFSLAVRYLLQRLTKQIYLGWAVL